MASLQETYISLKNQIKGLSVPGKLLLTLARELYIITNKRIFTDGKLVNGSKLTYSSRPILAGSSSFANKSGFNKIAGSKKKRSELKWVTLKSGARLFEIKGGFKEIKTLSGRPNPFDFTGQLKKSYTFSANEKQGTIGFSDVKRIAPNGSSTDVKNSDIIEGLTNKKGDIFGLSADEEKKTDAIINLYLDSILNGK